VIGDNPAPLPALPAGLHIPQRYQNRVHFDVGAGALIVSDRIAGDERQELLSLSADVAWQAAVNQACTDANNRAGLPQPLQITPLNSEYPFWSEAAGALVTPASELNPRQSGVKAMKIAIAFFKTMSRSDPRALTSPLSDFFDRYPLSSDLDEFPET